MSPPPVALAPLSAAPKQRVPHTQKIEVEVRNQDEVAEALEAGADILLLDNMSLDELSAAVELVGDRAITEASGGSTWTVFGPLPKPEFT